VDDAGAVDVDLRRRWRADARWNDLAACSIVAGIGIARLIRPGRWSGVADQAAIAAAAPLPRLVDTTVTVTRVGYAYRPGHDVRPAGLKRLIRSNVEADCRAGWVGSTDLPLSW
jgi:hypothetical protein